MEPTPKEIRAQLDRILMSQGFRASERLADFLEFVVEETLAGHAREINQRTIGIKGLGYADNFDPLTNPAVRIQAGRLRRALDHYYLTHGIEDSVRIDVPKGSYVPVFLSNDSPAPRTETNIKSEGSTSYALEPKMPEHDGPSIAVMPFEYLGNDVDDAFIASGITEETVIALTRFPDFLVVGPLNREIIKMKHMEPRAIGQEYNVRFILDGTVRLRGQTLRLTAKLADAYSGRQLWAQKHDYDVEMNSIDEIEGELVSQIVASIADNFGVIPRTLAKEVSSSHNESLSDYEAILKFHHHVQILSEESLVEAIAALEKTVERNPKHDLAVALLADLVGTPYWLGYVDDISGLDRAESLANQAMALAPNLQEARFSMAEIHYLRSRKAACLFELERVLELNPNNARALANVALFLMGLGQWDRSFGLMEKAMCLNPHHPGWYHLVPFLCHYYQGGYEVALLYANQFNTPVYFWDPLIRTAVLGQLGNHQEAHKAKDELLVLVPDFDARGHSLIKRMLFQDEHVEALVDGLRKAGLGW